MMRGQQQEDHQAKVFYELSALVLNLLRSPSSSEFQFSDQSPPPSDSSRRMRRSTTAAAQISPAGFASLMLGISTALMLCGSVTFFIGFIMMPWILGLVIVFYVIGIVSTISMLGRSLLSYALAPPPSPRKDIPFLLKCIINSRSNLTTMVESLWDMKTVCQIRMFIRSLKTSAWRAWKLL